MTGERPPGRPGRVMLGELTHELGFTDVERAEISVGTQQMISEAHAFRRAEARRRQHTTQVEVATAMGVAQARVSRIEKGQLERSEVDTLAALAEHTAQPVTISGV